jgi:hypothetical protein
VLRWRTPANLRFSALSSASHGLKVSVAGAEEAGTL